jgi:hypothetical protein
VSEDKQHPILHFEKADNFVIAYYAAGDSQQKAVPFSLKPKSGLADDNNARTVIHQQAGDNAKQFGQVIGNITFNE